MRQKRGLLKQEKWIIVVELIVALALLAALIFKATHPVTIQIDMSRWTSDYMTYQNGSWGITDSIVAGEDENSEDLATDQDDDQDSAQQSIDIILTSDTIHLDADSYTMTLLHHGNGQVKCYLSSQDRGLHAGKFLVSKNKTSANYDFFVIRDINQFQINITNYESGDFYLDGITITTNANNLRLLLFAWLVFCALIDFVLFSQIFQRHGKVIIALLVLSVLVSAANAFYGIHIGHDMAFHMQRIEGIAEGLAHGQFPVRMSTTFNDGYGYPVGVFYGDLLLYIPAILRLIGLPLLTSYKIYIWLVNLLTLSAAYYCGLTFFGKRRLSLLVAIAYTASSYRLMDLYVRSAAGEYTALIFLPVIAAAFYRIYTDHISAKGYQKNAIILALGMAGLLYTHVLTTEMAVLMAVLTALIFIKRTVRKETLLVLFKAIGLCLTLGLCYIVPFLDYYIHTDTMIKESGETAATIQQSGGYISQYFAFFRTIYGANDTDPSLRMQITPGPLLMLTIIAALIVILVKRADKRIYFLTAMSLLSLFMASNLFPWDFISKTTVGNMLAAVQFPWRYLGFATLFMALLLGCLIEKIPGDGHWRVLLSHGAALIAIFTLGLFVLSYGSGVSSVSYVDTLELPSYIGIDVNGKEYLLTGTDIEKLDYDVTATAGQASLLSEDGLDMTIEVDADEATTIEVPRFAYPYFTAVTDSGESLAISSGTNNKMAIALPEAYSGTINISFHEPIYWRLAEVISLISLAGIIICVRRREKN